MQVNPRVPSDEPSELPIGDDANEDPMQFPSDPADREDVIDAGVPDSPEMNVLTLDGDDFLPNPDESARHKP